MPRTLLVTVNILAIRKLVKKLPRDQFFIFRLTDGFELTATVSKVGGVDDVIKLIDIRDGNIANVNIEDIEAIIRVNPSDPPIPVVRLRNIPCDVFVSPGARGIERAACRLIGKLVRIFSDGDFEIIDTQIREVVPGLIYTDNVAISSADIQIIEERSMTPGNLTTN